MVKKNLLLSHLMWLVMLIAIVPISRALSFTSLNEAKSAAWLSPIVSGCVFLPLLLMYCFMMKRTGFKNLPQMIDDIFGVGLGPVLNILFAIWALFRLAFNLEQFSTRIVGVLLPNASSIIFSAIMLFLCAYAIRLGKSAFTRASAIFAVAVSAVLIFSCFALIGMIDPMNLLPVSTADFVPIVKTLPTGLSIFSLFFYVVMFIDEVKDPEKITKKSLIMLIFIVLFQTALIIVPIGVFGESAASELNYPLLAAAKNINAFGAVEKTDSIIVVTLMLADFVSIALSMFFAIKSIKHTAKLKDTNAISNILFVLAFIVSITLTNNYFQFKEITEDIVVNTGVFFCVAVPIIMFVVGLIRGKFKKDTKKALLSS